MAAGIPDSVIDELYENRPRELRETLIPMILERGIEDIGDAENLKSVEEGEDPAGGQVVSTTYERRRELTDEGAGAVTSPGRSDVRTRSRPPQMAPAPGEIQLALGR